MTNHNTATLGRAERDSRLEWVRLRDMETSTHAQRAYSEPRATKIAADLDLEAIGYPVLSYREGRFFILDGQHRIGALRIFGFGDRDSVQCEVYRDLTEEEEAELFLQRDNRTALLAFDRFRIGRFAGRAEEVDIDRIVQAQGLVVSNHGDVIGGVRAVTTLRSIYRRSGPDTLGTTLRIIRDAWGNGAYNRSILEGVGLVLHRYNGQIDEQDAIARLMVIPRGVLGVLNQSEIVRRATGRSRAECVASVVVETLNRRRRGGAKLASWWKL